MPVTLGQLIYTSFDGVGLTTLASIDVPTEFQQAFIQQVVYQYWEPYKLKGSGYRAAYLHQVTLEHTLFGWLYNDGVDDLGRSNVPYFVCYHLAEVMDAAQLENIFICLQKGPVALIDRQCLPATLETIVVPNLWNYQPARSGVAIPSDVRSCSHISLGQKRLLDLFVPVDEPETVNKVNEQIYNQQEAPVQPLVTAMTEPSSYNSNNSKGNLTINAPEQTARLRESPRPRRQGWGEWSLKAKATVWALAVSMLPVLAVGTTYYLGSQSISKQFAQARLADATSIAETELAVQRQLSLLLVGTGVTAVLAGAIAAIVANRALSPVLNAAAASNTLVNRLRREEVSPSDRLRGKDELVALETNISLIEKQLPDLLWKQEAEAERFQVLMNITRHIQESRSEENVFRTTVEEVRKTFRTDRVVIFRFDSNWNGTFVEESVAPGWPKMLWSTIHDPCFEGEYVEQYRNGRVSAIDDIYQAGLTDCHIGLLERFAVKANLVAPILKDNQLLGLLIAHQCSGSRDWQQSEIDLFAQLATQVGFALDHARLLNQVEQAYQAAEAACHSRCQQKEALQRQVSELLRDSKIVVDTLSTEALGQIEFVRAAYNQIQAVADSAREMIAFAQQAKLQDQQLSQTLQDGHSLMNGTLDGIYAIRETVVEAAEKVKRLDQPFQKLSQIVSLISQVASQMKLQAMSAALEAARTGKAGQEFASIAEKALFLTLQLNTDIAKIEPLVAEIQTKTNEVVAAMEVSAEQAIAGTQLVEETQQKLNSVATVSTQIKTLVKELAQAAAFQAQTSTSASQSILEVASITNQTSEQSLAVAESLVKLAAVAQ